MQFTKQCVVQMYVKWISLGIRISIRNNNWFVIDLHEVDTIKRELSQRSSSPEDNLKLIYKTIYLLNDF